MRGDINPFLGTIKEKRIGRAANGMTEADWRRLSASSLSHAHGGVATEE